MIEKRFSDGDDELEPIIFFMYLGAHCGLGPVLVSETQVCVLSWCLCFRVTVKRYAEGTFGR